MNITDKSIARYGIEFFEGVNSTVVDHITKKQELSHCENVRSDKIGRLAKRGGYEVLGGALSSTANYGLYYFKVVPYFYRVSTVSGTTTIYYLDSNLAWIALTGGGTGLTAGAVDFAEAEGNLIVVNGLDDNRYIQSDGTTVVVASTASVTNHLYNSPKAYKANFYKGRIYLGDYTISGGTRQKNGIMFSSPLVGIVALVDGDYTAAATSLKVTDTKYIYASDSLEIYRGTSRVTFNIGSSDSQFDITNPSGTTFRYTWDTTGTDPLITTYVAVNTELTIAAQNFNSANNGTFTVTAVDANYFEITNASGVAESNKTIGTGSIRVNNIVVSAKESSATNTLTITAFNGTIKSSDEVWVKGTKTGSKVFRWAGDGATGTEVKEYDTFKLEGSDFNTITMMENVGDVQMFGGKNNLAIWNGSNLRNLDMGIGCVSPQGYVKKWGSLFFVHYNGIYVTNGDTPVLISSKIQRYIDGATRAGLEASAAGWHNFSVYFSIGDVTLYNEDGSTDKTLTDVLLEYNIKQKNWFIHTKISVDYMSDYVTVSSAQEYIAFSNPDTDKLYIFPYGTDDDDTDIHMRADTSIITLQSQFEKISYPKEIIIESPQGHNIHAFVSLDGKPFYEIEGTTEKGCSILKVTGRTPKETPARCRTIKISLRESSMSSCKVNRMALIYQKTTEEENYHE